MQESIAVGILTIGTEVAHGQIINSNSGWIANELTNLRLDPRWHLTVADHRSDMHDALYYLQKRAKIIIVTGGLGPTSDDFTRDVIAEWSNQPLTYDENSWKHIVDRYSHLSAPPPESNRQQCYFPEKARILTNARGTAHAFSVEAHGVLVYVLPGPPEEIKTIWKDHIQTELASKAQHTDAHRLKRWHCLGISESALGELVEGIIKGSSLTAGYRPHIPFVEVKIWCRESLLEKEKPVLEALDAALDRWTATRDEEDSLDILFEKLQAFDDIEVEDSATHGVFSQRLGQRWPKTPTKKLSIREDFSPEYNVTDIRGPLKASLIIGPLKDDGSWDIWLKTAHMQKLQTLQLPFKRHPERFLRERLFVCEQSLLAFSRLTQKGNLVL